MLVLSACIDSVPMRWRLFIGFVFLLVISQCDSSGDRIAMCPTLYIVRVDGRTRCTGFFVGPNTVMTARHCITDVDDPTRVTLSRPQQDVGSVPVTDIQSRPGERIEDDVAILTASGVTGETQGSGGGDAVDRILHVCAAYRGLEMRPVIARQRTGPLLFLSGSICPGDSGAPIVDAAGRVRGVAVFSDRRGANECSAAYSVAVRLR